MTPAIFSESDATALRAAKISYSSQDAAALPPELRRYLDHYGFSRLLETEPQVMHALNFHSWTGFDVAVHTWRQAEARGTVIVVHGLFDHTGLYLKLIEQLLTGGYNVVAFDLPGHGLSSGEQVSIGNFAEYKSVLSECISWCAKEIPGPYHLVGQSTGCSAILYLFLQQNPAAAHIQKAVLLAPLVRARAWGKLTLAHSLLGWMISKVPRQFGANSHDTAFLRFLHRQDPLQARHIDVLWVGAMRSWVNSFFRVAPPSGRALLIIQGTGDTTVDWRWNLPQIRKKFPRAQIHYVKGARHHLVNEANPWRTEAFRTLSGYLSP